MPPRTRRTRARQRSAPAEDEALEPSASDSSEALEPAASDSSVSRRGRAGRSSRRAQAASARQSSRTSARKELSDEEKAARRAAIRNTLLTVVVLLVVGGGAFGAWYALREEPRTVEVELMGETEPFTGTRGELARLFMQKAAVFEDKVEKALRARRPDEAKDNLQAMVNLLKRQELGGGVTPNPEDPNIGDLQLATRAVAMLGEVPAYETEINRLRDDRRANVNFGALKQELNRLRDPELNLDQLEEDMRRFMENPVRPAEGSNPDLQQRYRVMVDEVAANLHQITSERTSRLIGNTTTVVETTNLETQKYLAKSQYGTALSLVDEVARNRPQADLKPVREKIMNAAERGWESDRSRAENLFRDAVAPGVGDQARAEKLSEAIRILEYAVANYGRDVREFKDYVQQAERLLREYKGRL